MGSDDEKSAAFHDGGYGTLEHKAPSPPTSQTSSAQMTEMPTKGEEDLASNPASLKSSRSPEVKNEKRPPLPPRPTNLGFLQPAKESRDGASPKSEKPTRPRIVSTPTTAVSRTDIETHILQDGSRETYAANAVTNTSAGPKIGFGSLKKFKGVSESESGDTESLRSYIPISEGGGETESLLGEVLGTAGSEPLWHYLNGQITESNEYENWEKGDEKIDADFYREFDQVPAIDTDSGNEEEVLEHWKSKRKHFIILSAAGKPIYNRHGDDSLISGYIGLIQTIISFYEGAKDQLKSFTAADARFVVVSKGPLHLVAISKLGENDSQLRMQLEALYMQILSTLTLPTLTHLFAARASTDLRRPLQGTEPLLSALADAFTRGSPPALLSALECLKIRKSERQIINDTLLRTRCDTLLYGLIVASGRLVSVVRPRKHSLHPSDLQLIFNMLFEARGVKAGGGENWIPICLPGFNRNGYLCMYVSFVSAESDEIVQNGAEAEDSTQKEEIAVLLISPSKESFYDLRKMRDTVVAELEKNGSMSVVKAAVRGGRPTATDIVPGMVLRHFLYKSRTNVQFVMPSYEPYYNNLLETRELLSLYHKLHASVHARNAHLKIHYCIGKNSISLTWVTPTFELYCVAGPQSSRKALAQSANTVIKWARREEERIFIIGGAVF